MSDQQPSAPTIDDMLKALNEAIYQLERLMDTDFETVVGQESLSVAYNTLYDIRKAIQKGKARV